MSTNSTWLELIIAASDLLTMAPRDSSRGRAIADWYERHHQATGRGALVAERKHAPNRVGDVLRRCPDHALFVYRDDATREAIERRLIEDWPRSLLTALIVDGGGNEPCPTHMLYRDAVAWFVVEHSPQLAWRRVRPRV